MTTVTKAKKSPCLSDSHHLFDAVLKGKIHLTRFILAAANSQLQNAWDKDGRTPLIACCDIKEEGTRDQIVQILLEGGADVNMTDREGRSPLIHACEKRCNDIVRILIHHNHIKPDIEDSYGNTALIYCAAVGNDVATELLTRNFRRLGLQVDHFNKQGNTALHLATKNNNMNCAKILAQRGRASVNMKDKEYGLTPMEWCLKQGYDKDEIEFLKPMTRFYRVAKLATSLSRSRSSIAAFNHEAKPAVTPSKSVDSCMGNSTKGRTKGTLSRSKSQTVESSRRTGNATAAGVTRQATVDVPTTCHRRLPSNDNTKKTADNRPSLVAGMKVKDAKPRKEEKKNHSNDKVLKRTSSTKGNAHVKSEIETSGKLKANLKECINVSSMSLSEKSLPADDDSSVPRPDQPSTTLRAGQLTGLGCSLSITSMVSSATSLGSCDYRSDSSRTSSQMGDVSPCTEITYFDRPNENGNQLRSSRAIRSGAEDSEASLADTSATSCSEAMESQSSDFTSDTSVSDYFADNPGHSIDNRPRAVIRYENTSRKANGRKATGSSVRQNQNLSDVVNSAVDFNHEEGLPDISRSEISLACSSGHDSDSPQTCSFHRDDDSLQSFTGLQGEDDDALDTEDKYPEAGHNVLNLVTSSTASITEYNLRGSPSGQESRLNVSHVRSNQEISQDA